jgi:hypothetical protein
MLVQVIRKEVLHYCTKQILLMLSRSSSLLLNAIRLRKKEVITKHGRPIKLGIPTARSQTHPVDAC